MMTTRVHDKQAAEQTERSYKSPDIVKQRMSTLDALAINAGDHVLDIGCGPGLLTHDIALMAGSGGHVVGIDISQAMLALARRRCTGLSQVILTEGNAERLAYDNGCFDAVACTQVLLYLDDPAAAIVEMHRVMRPGARIAIVETDWRSMVLNSFDDQLTRRIVSAWDDTVSSPNLPPRLIEMMRGAGLAGIRVMAIPLLNTSRTAGNFSTGTIMHFANNAVLRGAVEESEAAAWQDDLRCKGKEGTYFFSVNRFLFSAVRT